MEKSDAHKSFSHTNCESRTNEKKEGHHAI